jgi:hypothetical protein
MGDSSQRWAAALRALIKLEVFALAAVVCGVIIYPPGWCGRLGNRVAALRLPVAKQIGQAHLAYAQDYDERFCPAVLDNPALGAAEWYRLRRPRGCVCWNRM